MNEETPIIDGIFDALRRGACGTMVAHNQSRQVEMQLTATQRKLSRHRTINGKQLRKNRELREQNAQLAETAKHRAELLIDFVFQVRRGNLTPYCDREEFLRQIEDLCARAEEHFEHPLEPFAPMPAPRPLAEGKA